jgi:hypothetical protein
MYAALLVEVVRIQSNNVEKTSSNDFVPMFDTYGMVVSLTVVCPLPPLQHCVHHQQHNTLLKKPVIAAYILITILFSLAHPATTAQAIPKNVPNTRNIQNPHS